MKIGVCASADRAALLSELGYDYIELTFNQLPNMEEDRFRQQIDLLMRAGLAAESYNCFFPGDIQLYAPDGNQDALLRRVKEYAEQGFARASRLGGKVAVMGSGWVRKIPDGMTKDEVDRQFARVLAICGEAADDFGMKIAVEPLARNECNYIHTVEEAAVLARLSRHPSVGVTIDFFHHAKNEDDLTALPKNAGYLMHAHLARPSDRKPPNEEDADLLRAYAEMLTYCPGVERISLECAWGADFADELRRARPVMEVFKSV
ncbi:MAG: sugar phosphate isomerase/epimerase [Clostridia bacterium]|nr:sugar phosphate isomerase/epimerase [Clostridia bacterium]